MILISETKIEALLSINSINFYSMDLTYYYLSFDYYLLDGSNLFLTYKDIDFINFEKRFTLLVSEMFKNMYFNAFYFQLLIFLNTANFKDFLICESAVKLIILLRRLTSLQNQNYDFQSVAVY